MAHCIRYQVDPIALKNALESGFPIEQLERFNEEILPATFGVSENFKNSYYATRQEKPTNDKFFNNEPRKKCSKSKRK